MSKLNNPFHPKWMAKRIGKVDVKHRLRLQNDMRAKEMNYPGWCGKIGIRANV